MNGLSSLAKPGDETHDICDSFLQLPHVNISSSLDMLPTRRRKRNIMHQRSRPLLQSIERELSPQMQFTSLMLRLGVVDNDDVLVDNGNNAGSGGKWKDVECVLETKLGAAEGAERLFKEDNLFVDTRSRREG